MLKKWHVFRSSRVFLAVKTYVTFREKLCYDLIRAFKTENRFRRSVVSPFVLCHLLYQIFLAGEHFTPIQDLPVFSMASFHFTVLPGWIGANPLEIYSQFFGGLFKRSFFLCHFMVIHKLRAIVYLYCFDAKSFTNSGPLSTCTVLMQNPNLVASSLRYLDVSQVLFSLTTFKARFLLYSSIAVIW